MGYKLNNVSIKTDNSLEEIKKIDALWKDILSGKLPLLLDSEGHFQNGILPIAKYHHYESDGFGQYELTIIGETNDFFQKMEEQVQNGLYIKIDESGEDVSICTKAAWQKVWSLQQTQKISRAFTQDFESSIPSAYAKDGKAHCYLYIAVK